MNICLKYACIFAFTLTTHLCAGMNLVFDKPVSKLKTKNSFTYIKFKDGEKQIIILNPKRTYKNIKHYKYEKSDQFLYIAIESLSGDLIHLKTGKTYHNVFEYWSLCDNTLLLIKFYNNNAKLIRLKDYSTLKTFEKNLQYEPSPNKTILLVKEKPKQKRDNIPLLHIMDLQKNLITKSISDVCKYRFNKKNPSFLTFCTKNQDAPDKLLDIKKGKTYKNITSFCLDKQKNILITTFNDTSIQIIDRNNNKIIRKIDLCKLKHKLCDNAYIIIEHKNPKKNKEFIHTATGETIIDATNMGIAHQNTIKKVIWAQKPNRPIKLISPVTLVAKKMFHAQLEKIRNNMQYSDVIVQTK